MVLVASQLRLDKRCGKSGIPDNRKCSKQTAALTQQSTAQSSNPTGLLLTSPGVLAASTVLGVLAKDIYSSGVPADKVPPRNPPDGLYDSFKPGDLIYQTDEFAGAQRAHYAVYLGKINGVHKVFDTSLKKIGNKSASQMLIRTIEEATSTGTSFALAAREDKGANKSPTRDQLLKIVNRLNGKTFDWTGFESNCETLARSVINDIPVSTQSKNVSALSSELTKTFISALAPKDYRRRAVKQENVSRLVRRTLKDSAVLTRLDKKCGASGIPDNRKCSKPTRSTPSAPDPPRTASGSPLPAILAAAGITATAYIALRERYRSGVSAAATDAVRRSKDVDTTLKSRQKRIVFCVPGASGSESIQRGEGIQAAWQKSLSPERNKKDEKTIMVDTRKANLDPRDSADANPQEIMAMHLKNQVRGRNEAAVDLASQIIAFRRAHPDKQIVVVGHSYGGAIAEEALAIVSRTKTKINGIVNINFGTNNYGLLDGMVKSDVKQVTLGSPNDPFTARGPTRNLRNITTVRGHSLRDYSSDRQVQAFVRNLVEDRAPLMRRDTLTRLDKKCGASGIPDNAKCTKGGSWPQAATIGAALTAGGIAAFALTRGGSSGKKGSPPESGPPRLPGDRTTRQITGLTPKALLPPAPPRKSKTQRMRENTAAAARGAEQAIGRAAQAEITRAGAVANAMASAGEATGMAAKTTMRELRLRTEAARRRFEPGYRRSPSTTPKPPAQLPEGGGLPVSRGRTPSKAPSTVEEWANLAPDMNALRNAMSDPRTGQPRRRQARGFGRSDNYIPFYAPVALRGIQ